MLHERDAWWLVPLLSNLLLMAATIFAAPASFPHDSVSCVLVAALSSLIAFISVLGFVVHDIGAPKSFASLMGQTIILNVTYTVIYLYRGFDDLPMTFGQAFYFQRLPGQA